MFLEILTTEVPYLLRWKGSPDAVSWKPRKSLIRDVPDSFDAYDRANTIE